ncbi:MAG TPA: DUF4192 domain-containing protein [Amycolatopsis sp.]|jgi:hypothetical protein|nr:DUF4192 domain-containing protein [Amycolatopsis sp.]
MTTTSVPPFGGITARIHNPAQLIAAVPHLLGFRPTGSLVVIGLDGTTGGHMGPLIRADLPKDAHARDLAVSFANAVRGQPGRAFTFLIVGRHPDDSPPPGQLPHTRLVIELVLAFDRIGKVVDRVLFTPEIRAGTPWTCYHERGCAGVIPDDASTTVAATLALMGFVTFDSRAEMERQLDPDDPAAVAGRASLLRDLGGTPDSSDDPASGGASGDTPGERAGGSSFAEASDKVVDASIRKALHAVRELLDQAVQGPVALTDGQVVRLALALSHRSVRDACLATALPPASERSMRIEALWRELVRKTPAPHRAEPATLLGYSAYLRGDGAFARAAFHNALEAMPKHTLAGLLLRCLDSTMAPDRLRELGHPEDLAKLLGPVVPAPPAAPGDGP